MAGGHMDTHQLLKDMGQKASAAARKLAAATPELKEKTLLRLSELIIEKQDEITAANAIDLAKAEEKGIDAPRLNRLRLTPETIAEMANACTFIAEMDDPVGAIETQWQRPNGLLVGKMRIPLGVIAMIYESRPNVTIDSGILCLKAGNAIILRGGSEAINSNLALAKLLHEALEYAGLPKECVQVVPTTDREAITAMCKLEEHIDVIIPRGGETLIRTVVDMATMPVLKHYKGVCHAFIDKSANLEEALNIIINGKTQRPGVCNALEGLLVHKDIADKFLPMVAKELGTERDVEFRACARSLPLLGKTAVAMNESDPGTEYHDLILLVKTIDSMQEAQDYIAENGSNHTEIICTQDYNRALKFMREVDASCVSVNASTRFNDGGQLGLGAEIGISTSKLHSYGPMGVKELTTTKFVIFGQGQVRK
ncbi:glutamate-5-semialdehyde dehydrogenase [Halodesulfovibrio aestuarii]|nr:glutamate-5-semialdehyde dehydrogenase [Halodesulfovibrio aestuarii]